MDRTLSTREAASGKQAAGSGTLAAAAHPLFGFERDRGVLKKKRRNCSHLAADPWHAACTRPRLESV
jgi:hypothetical protein